MTRRRKVAGSPGFTLIELLVSLTILGVVLALAVGGLRVLSRTWELNTRRIQTLDMISRAADILKRDASSLQRVVSSASGQPEFVFKGTPTEMSFVALEPPFPARPGLYFINYRVEPNGRQLALVRARAQFRNGMVKFPGATPANRVPLLQVSSQITLSYGYTAGGREVWLSLWPHNNRLPELIRLDIAPATGGLAVPLLIVRVRADAELACLSEGAAVCSAKSDGVLEGRAMQRKGDASESEGRTKDKSGGGPRDPG